MGRVELKNRDQRSWDESETSLGHETPAIELYGEKEDLRPIQTPCYMPRLGSLQRASIVGGFCFGGRETKNERGVWYLSCGGG